MKYALVLVLAIVPCFAFAEPETQQPAPAQTAEVVTTIITVDGEPVTDETQLLKLRLMIQQSGIAEPILVIETTVSDRPSNNNRHQVDGYTTIVTAQRFVTRIFSDQSDIRGTVWTGNDAALRARAAKIAISTSWRMALAALAREVAVDTTGTEIGRVTVDDHLVTDNVELTKLHILMKKAGVTEPVQLVETWTKERASVNNFHQVDAFSNVATTAKMLENVPSEGARDTMWSGNDEKDLARAKSAAVIESWTEACRRLAAPAATKVFVQ
ncbi:MAG: hypothetical protein Q7S16_02125 [bacterium]|nr:hypothetical protein [bacterium]